MSWNPEACFIAPREQEAFKVARWLDGGNPRGFVLADKEETLVIFDGYGNTHTSMMQFFGLRARDIAFEFILLQNGLVSVDLGLAKKRMAVAQLFNPTATQFFRVVAKLRGLKVEPYCVPMA